MSQFTKRFIAIGGRAVPAIQISPSEDAMVTLPARDGQPPKQIRATFATLFSLRETNPANGPVTTYYAATRENLRFATLRFTDVPNLDYDPETGAVLTIEVLEARRMADILARQEANAAATQTASVDLDLA